MEDQPKVETIVAPDICPTHKTAMITQQEHIGDGKTRTSDPFCPACRSIEAGEKPLFVEPNAGSKPAPGAEA